MRTDKRITSADGNNRHQSINDFFAADIMQTQKPAISLLSSLNNNAPAARQGSNNAPEVSFNQVLSREVSRQPTRQPEHQSERVNTPQPAQNTSKAAESANRDKNTGPLPPQNQAQPENAASQGSQSTAGSTPPGQGNGTAKANNGSDGSDATAPGQSDSVAAASVDPTAALLALVASFNNPAASTAKAGPAAGAEASSVASVSSKADKTTDVALLKPQAATSGDDKPADPFATLLPSDAKAAPEAKPEVQDAAPKLAASKPETGAKLNAADAKPDAAPQLVANTDNPNASPVATRAAVKIDAAVSQTTSEGNSATTITAVAQAAASANTPAIAKLQAQLAPRVGNPGWDQALGQHVVYMAGQGSQTASLTLNPPDLGPIQVVLNISNDQANASFTAVQPEVRAALEAAMPKLREMMSEAGITLGNATVGTGLPNQQQSTPGEQARQQGNNGHASTGPELRDDGQRTVLTRPVNASLGLVDTFV